MKLDKALAQLEGAAHVGGDPELEDRRFPGFCEPSRDRPAHRGELLDLDLVDRRSRERRDRHRGSAGSRGSFDVLRDDSALWTGAGNRAELDAPFPGDPARQRGGLDPAAVVGRRLPDLGDGLAHAGRSTPPTLALFLTRAPGRSFCPRILVHLLCPGAVAGSLLRLDVFGDLFALLADHRDRPADVDLARRDGDLQQDTRGVRLDLLRDLVRVQLVERFALLDLVAFGLQPLDDRPGLHALAQPR